MNWLWIALGMAVLPFRGAQNGTELAPITLYTEFAAQPPGSVLEAMQSEVESIMAPMGLRFHWLEMKGADGSRVSVELAVITFKGRCDLAGLLPHDENPGPLGWTHISNGVILPFANVDCTAIRNFIQKELLIKRVDTRAAIYGRALGRVLAHELYHIFANTTRHGAEGVAREFYSVNELLSPDFQFQAKESQALLNSKVHAALAATPALVVDDAEHRN